MILSTPQELSLAGWSLGARAATCFASQLERTGKASVECIFALDDRRKFPFSEVSLRSLVSVLCAAESVPAFRTSALC